MEDRFLAIYLEDEKVRDLVAHTLRIQLGREVVTIHSMGQCQPLSGKTGVLITDGAQLADEAFKNFLQSNSLITVLSSGGEAFGKVKILSEPLEMSELISALKQYLNLEDVNEPEYFPIPSKLFHYIKTVPCDVFIRLGKEPDNLRYVKRLYGNQIFERSEIEKYEAKGIFEFFVNFANKDLFLSYLVQKLSPEKMMSEAQERGFIDVNGDMHQIVSEVMDKSQVSEETIQLANTSIKAMASTVQNSKSLLGLLKELLRNKQSYNYKHSFLISVFCFEVMKRIELGKTSRLEEQHIMMSFVSFYHDILLKKEEMVRIRNKKEFFRAELSPEDKDLVKNHAKLISDIVGENKGTPAGAAQILRHHHGMTNGIGFPSAYNASIPNLAIVFIISEFFVHHVLNPEGNGGSIIKIFEIMDEEFTLPTYRKIVGSLKEVFGVSA